MDVGNSEPKTITLLIKTPSQAYEDHVIENVHLNWTVKELKAHLSTVYPGRPAATDQRLIYAGRLLPDHLHMKDLFKQIEIIPVLHLVCSFRNRPQEQLGARPKTRATEQAGPSSSSSTAQFPRAPELRHRRQTSPASLAAAPAHTHSPGTPPWPAAAPMPGAPEMTQPAFPIYSLYSPQQLLWLQHIYARQYYMQYHAALAATHSNSPTSATTIGQYPPVPAHQVPVPAPLANQNPINDIPVNQNPAQDGAFLNAAEANQNMRMNAQGGPVMEDEEDMERDWLDWLYSAARVGVLLMIVYFNSNLSRFLLVMSTLLLMYLHTVGWFPFRRRVPNHLQPPEVQHNQQNQNPNQVEELPDRQAAAAEDRSDEPMTAVLVPPHRTSVMWSAWVFFRSFFSSLIPEVPQGVAN